jgi:VCBS repeat protein
VAVGNFNADNRPDFAIPTFFGFDANLAVYLNTSGGNHAKSGDYAAGSLPIGTAVADLTGDGRPDLAVVNKFSTDVYVYPGRGDGTFAKPRIYVVGHSPDWIAAADFNNDGWTDLAVANSTAGTITLLKSPTPAATFRVTILPATTTAGAALKVTVSAIDGEGHLATGFTGKVTLTSSDSKAVLPLPYTFTAADLGTKTFIVTLKTAGTQTIQVNGGALGGNDSVDVVAAAASSFSLSAPSSTVTGAAFDLTVTARDRFGNVAAGYRGTIKFTSSDKSLGVLLPPNYTFDAVDDGTHTFSVTLIKAGKQTVTVKDVAKPTILYRSASVTVNA